MVITKSLFIFDQLFIKTLQMKHFKHFNLIERLIVFSLSTLLILFFSMLIIRLFINGVPNSLSLGIYG